MFRPRIIPVLLLNQDHLVKSTRFKNYNYIGDPINAVKIFNEFKADELVFLDISASKNKRLINIQLVQEIGEEANMPFCVGGGITKLSDIAQLIAAGAEKVIIGSEAAINPGFIKEATNEFGTSTIAVCMDVKSSFLKKQKVWYLNATESTKYTPLDFAKLMEDNGAGELIIQSVDNDGRMAGYDLPLVNEISSQVKIPTIALGGAGNIQHLKEGYIKGHATGLAAGSMFVYIGSHKGVLINYLENRVNFYD